MAEAPAVAELLEVFSIYMEVDNTGVIPAGNPGECLGRPESSLLCHSRAGGNPKTYLSCRTAGRHLFFILSILILSHLIVALFSRSCNINETR